MEGDPSQTAVGESFKVTEDSVNKGRIILMDRSRDSNENCDNGSIGYLYTGEIPSGNEKGCRGVEHVSVVMSESYAADKKSPGALTVPCASPSSANLTIKKASQVHVTDSSEDCSERNIIADTSKKDTESRKVYTIDSTTSSRNIETYSGDRPSEEIGVHQGEFVYHNVSKAVAKPSQNVDAASVIKGMPQVFTKLISSNVTESISESNVNNNNNIDKPTEACASFSLTAVEKSSTISHVPSGWNVSQRLVGNVSSPVPYVNSEIYNIRGLHSGSTDTSLHSDSSSVRIISLSADTFQPASVVVKSDGSKGESSTCGPSFNQSLQQAKLSMEDLGDTGFSTAVAKNIDSVSRGHNRELSSFLPRTEPLLSGASYAIHGSSVNSRSAHNTAYSEKIPAVNQPSSGTNRNEVTKINSCIETGNDTSVSQSKSFTLHLGTRHPQEVLENSKVDSEMASKSVVSEEQQIPTIAHISHLVKQRFSGIYAKPADNLFAVHSPGAGNQMSLTDKNFVQNVVSRDLSSVSFGKLRETLTKSAKKPRSRNPKPKSQTSLLLADNNDDNNEDDDNDFIPVGMLQLSALKRSDGKVVTANVTSIESGKGVHQQMNPGLDVRYEQHDHVKDNQTQSVEKTGFGRGNELRQEKHAQYTVQEHKLKPQVGVEKQQGTHIQMLAQGVKTQQEGTHIQMLAQGVKAQKEGTPIQILAQGVKAQQQDVQQHESQQQHQLLLQLVQQAQQQQKQLQDQQQLWPQSSSSVSLTSGILSKSTSFPKNQGLIIHCHQPRDAKIATSSEGLSQPNLQKVVSICPVDSEHHEDIQFKKEQTTEQSIQQPPQTSYKPQENNAGIEKLQKEQRYSQQLPISTTISSGHPHKETPIMHKEYLWQAQSSSIPKLAEMLFQQSVTEQMLQTSKAEQILQSSKEIFQQSVTEQMFQSSKAEQLLCKTDQLIQHLPQQISTDQIISRPVTPTASSHHAAPSVNQQHPEIARMLNSPVSPRQSGSPRQSVSPRRTISPFQSITSSTQFISPRKIVSPHPRQSANLCQPLNAKPINRQPSSSYHSASSKPVASSQQFTNTWQGLNPSRSSISPAPFLNPDQAQPYTGQVISVQIPISHSQIEHARVESSLPVKSTEKNFSSNVQRDDDICQETDTYGQHAAPDFSINLSSSSTQQVNPTEPISIPEPVQTFSPGQIIHHRPQERGHTQNKGMSVLSPQSSFMVQFSSPAVPSSASTVLSTKLPVPRMQNPTSVWHSLPSQVTSRERSVQSPKSVLIQSAQPENIQRLAKQTQHIQKNQHEASHQNLVSERSDIEHLQPLTSQTHLRSRSPDNLPTTLHYQNQGTESHLYPSTQFVQATSTPNEAKLMKPYIGSIDHDRNFQIITSLAEKENSLIQSLFADNSVMQSSERTQPNMTQPSHTSSHQAVSSSTDTLQKCEDRGYTDAGNFYPEMRKNEGGLKVLSEIASERYELAVAGKDDINDLTDARTIYPSTTQITLTSETGQHNSECHGSKTKHPKIKPSSNIKKSGDLSKKAKLSIEVKKSGLTTQSKLVEKETKRLSLAHRETSRREVRQRKPKIPFEQDDTPVKRNIKTSPQKNSSNQKQIPVIPTRNPSHKKGHGKKATLAKLKKESEQEKMKEKSTRQSRFNNVGIDSNNRNTDTSMEDVEDSEHTESEISSRRSSLRLQVKEKERLESHETADVTQNRRISRNSTQVNYKEDASDSEIISPRSTRSSRQASISSFDDIATSETPERMTTRSVNRSVGNRAAMSSEKKNDNKKQKLDCFTEKKKGTNTPLTNTVTVVATGTNTENKRDTRSSLRNLGQESQSQRLDKSASSSSRIVSPVVVKLEGSKVGAESKVKRSVPSDFVDELPLLQKRLRKVDTPKNTCEIRKQDKKSGQIKLEASKERLNSEIVKEKTPESKVQHVKHIGAKKHKYKKKFRMKVNVNTIEAIKKPEFEKRENEEFEKSDIELSEEVNQQDNKLDSSSDNKLDSSSDNKLDSSSDNKLDSSSDNKLDSSSDNKLDSSSDNKLDSSSYNKLDSSSDNKLDSSSDNKLDSSSDNKLDSSSDNKLDSSSDNKDDSSSDNKCGSRSDNKFGSSSDNKLDSSSDNKLGSSSDNKLDSSSDNAESNLKEAGSDIEVIKTKEKVHINSETSTSNDDKVNPPSEKRTDVQSREVVTEVKLKHEFIEQQSVIKSTSLLSSSAVKVREPDHLSVPSLVPAKVSTDANSSYHATLAGDRLKMVMYKLVPIDEDDNISNVQETLVPIVGYYVHGGSSHRVLLPHNFMHGPATTKMSSSVVTAQVSSSLLPALTPQTLAPVLTSVMPPSGGSPNQPLPPETSTTSSSASMTTVCSVPKTALSTTVVSTLPSTVWSVPLRPSTVSSVSQPSVWTPQAPPSSLEASSVDVPKKTWTSSVSISSPSHYRPSPSWNRTPPQSSSQTPSSTSWNSPSSTPLQQPSQQRHEQQQQWIAPSQQAPQEQPWSSSTSVTAATLDSWSKEFFSSSVSTDALNQRHAEPLIQGSSHHLNASSQNALLHSGYNMVAGSSQQPQMYAPSHDQGSGSNTLYNTTASHDSEFSDNRQDGIQGFLKQVASNPAAFSQELASFNLAQQDLVYLENRLRQTLSPNTLFSAVAAAYDDTSGHDPVGSHDSSLQDSISLVHTVNLDMAEGNLDHSANLDLSDIGNSSVTNVSRNLDGQGMRRSHQETVHAQVDTTMGSSEDVDVQKQQEESPTVAKKPKSAKLTEKKPIKVRKSQYEILVTNDVKKYKCLECGKHFAVSTIYRHLRIHDADYKVMCHLCGKQYTQQQSLIMHLSKFHGVKDMPADLKSPIDERLSSSDQEQLVPEQLPETQIKSPNALLKSLDTQVTSHFSHVSSDTNVESRHVPVKSPDTYVESRHVPVKSPDTYVNSPNFSMESLNMPRSSGTSMISPGESKGEQKTSVTPDAFLTSHFRSGLLKQQAAHQQVEELRKLKAEKKLAAARRKAEGHVFDDGDVVEDDSYRHTSEPEHCADEDTPEQAGDNTTNNSYFTNIKNEFSSISHNWGSSQGMSYTTSSRTANAVPDISRISTYPKDDYDNHMTTKQQPAAPTKFQYSSPHVGVSTVPLFHTDNIPKPISTAVVRSSLKPDVESQKETPSSENGPQCQGNKGDGKYVCEICNVEFSKKHGYLLHLRRHNKIKAEFCNYCDKSFHTRQELRSHERTHTGEKPFRCEICHTCFAHSGSFISHKRGHEKRGENQPFPVVDGQIQYPSTFKKPRLSGGTSDKPRRVRKTKKIATTPESADSDRVSLEQSQDRQETSVIQRNTGDKNLNQHQDAEQGGLSKDIYERWQNISEQRVNADSFRSSMGSPAVGDHNSNSSSLRMVVPLQDIIPHEQDSRSYAKSAESYSSSAGNVVSDYYINPPGYNQNVQQQEFLSPDVDIPSSPHNFYKQDKYYHRSPSVDTFPAASCTQSISMPVNLAVEKGQHFTGSQTYSDSGQGSGSYYSPQQHSSEYHYSAPAQSECIDYHQEDYEDSLSQYKNDPSSSEIVKKLLQHYNVPASTFQESLPLDYSHQIHNASEYNRLGHTSAHEYDNLGIDRSTPAPPPYSTSLSSHEKHFYSPHSSTPDYSARVNLQQTSLAPNQPSLTSHKNQHGQTMQHHLIPDEQFASPQIQNQAQNIYSSQNRYSTTHSYRETPFTGSSLAQTHSPSSSHDYKTESSRTQDYYSQPLPKFESLAREPISSPSTQHK